MFESYCSKRTGRLALQSLILSLFLSLPITAQTPATWAKTWNGTQYSTVTGSYQRPDPEKGAPWICLSHTSAAGAAAYLVPRPTFIHRSIKITVRVFGYDDGMGSGALVGIYNNTTRAAVMVTTIGKTAAWYSGSLTTDFYVIAGSADSVKVFLGAAGADHAHIQQVQLLVEYTATPPDLAPASFSLSGLQRAMPGEILSSRLAATITNQGGDVSGPFYFGVYISKMWQVRNTDTLLLNGRAYVAAVGPGTTIGAPFNAAIQIPSNLAPGAYYLGLIVDCDSTVTEADETNNLFVVPIIVGYGCSKLLLSADFNEDSPGASPDSSLPGEPVGDSITYLYRGFAGAVTVQDTLIWLPHRALVARLPDATYNLWMTFLTASQQYHPSVKVRLRYMTNNMVYASSAGITLIDTGNVEIARYGVSASSVFAGYTGGGGTIPLTVTRGGYLEFAIDFAARTTSLAVNGVAVAEAQNVPFIHSAATQLKGVQFTMNRGNAVSGTALFAFDDLIAEATSPDPVPPVVAPTHCPGAYFNVDWAQRPEVSTYRIYENRAVVYEGNASRLTISRPAGIYNYAVQERDDCGWGGLSDSVRVQVHAGPNRPDTLYGSHTTAAPGQLFTIFWDSLPGATNYELYEGTTLMFAGQGRSCNFSYTERRDYVFTLKACSPCGCSPLSRSLTVTVQDITDVDDQGQGAIPKTYALRQNYPNPFNPSTLIEYALPKRTHIRIEIFNALGQSIRTLVDEVKSAGNYQLSWNGTDGLGRATGSGVYLYRIIAGDYVQSRKMLLLK